METISPCYFYSTSIMNVKIDDVALLNRNMTQIDLLFQAIVRDYCSYSFDLSEERIDNVIEKSEELSQKAALLAFHFQMIIKYKNIEKKNK